MFYLAQIRNEHAGLYGLMIGDSVTVVVKDTHGGFWIVGMATPRKGERAIPLEHLDNMISVVSATQALASTFANIALVIEDKG